ncbi:MAG: dihydrodipicolinate synthase family protein [Deltaproteobacteria bacterium]|nr:dihydrodipicolinate synthase family protein [Deltaproteobacteria bacterium]
MAFKGIIPAVSTWFKEDGSLDFETQFDHTDFLIEAGVNGLFFQGSGGEFPYLTFSERKEHASAVVKHVNGRVPVLLGVGTNSINEAVELAQHAERAGADGIVSVTPYYWKVNDDSLLEFYTIIGQACSLPLVVYNFPALTGQRLSSGLLLRMAEKIPTLAGIKDTIDSYSHILDIILRVKSVHPDFSVLAGIDVYLLGTLMAGGDGLIGSTANFMPAPEVDLYQGFLDKDFDRVMDCQRKIAMLSAKESNELRKFWQRSRSNIRILINPLFKLSLVWLY